MNPNFHLHAPKDRTHRDVANQLVSRVDSSLRGIAWSIRQTIG